MSEQIAEKLPVRVSFFRLGIDNIPDWFMDRVSDNSIMLRGPYRDLQFCEIKTLEGTMRGDKGDCIIRGVDGEIYPCKPDIFAKTYKVVSP